MSTKQMPHDFEVDADEALAAACDMSAGPERTEALKKANRLRNAADGYALIFAAHSERSDRAEVKGPSHAE